MMGSASKIRRGGIRSCGDRGARCSGSSAMKASSTVAAPVPALSSAGRSGRQHLAGVHRRQPVEPLGLLHIGGRHDDAHAGAARADAVDQLPELAARERVDAGGRLVQNQQIRIVDQRAAEAEFLPHAARELLRRPIFKGRQPGAFEQFGDSPVALVTGLSEQAAEELDVLADAQIGIEILAQPLRHVGDPRTYRRPVLRIGDVATEDGGAAGLNLTRAGDDARAAWIFRPRRDRSARPCNRRDADRDVVQCGHLAVSLREASDRRRKFCARSFGGPCRSWARRPPDRRERRRPPAIRCARTRRDRATARDRSAPGCGTSVCRARSWFPPSSA